MYTAKTIANIENEDRNFDPISEHFAKKVYGGLKGEIRLAVLRRDLAKLTQQLTQKLQRPLRILDVGAGLAQLSLDFAKQGHDVTINDISVNMLQYAKQQAVQDGTVADINWLACPYQQLDDALTQISQKNGKFDLILCHALLEWLAKPHEIMPFFSKWLSDDGLLSLCFYNPASFVYRNLIMGNFNLLNKPNFKADNKKSLTPNNPVEFSEVEDWLKEEGLTILAVSGLRVFHDYSPLKRGGHTNPDAVIEMELRYSNQQPYMWLGRYLHVMATKRELRP